jgi:hypothetical protein
VLEGSGDVDLLQEPLTAERRSELRQEHLCRHRPAVLEILCEVDRGHTPAAKLPLDAIPIGQRVRILSGA